MDLLPNGSLIRCARSDDVPAIVSLLEDDVLEGPRRERLPSPQGGYDKVFRDIEADVNNELYVVTESLDGPPIATMQLLYFAGLSWQGAPRAHLQGVRVATSHRGRGTGWQLLQWAIGRAASRGCVLIQLSTDKRRVDAHRLYARLGFRASHEGFRLVIA